MVEAWKETLATVNYVEWNGGELEVKPDEIENNEIVEEYEANITNCDGIVISNLDENATIEDIKAIMKDAIPADDLGKISVHPTGSTRSKIVKDVDVSHAMSIARKLDSKSFKGRLLHCRPHVPLSPPKTPNNPTESSEEKAPEEPSKAVAVETNKPVDVESNSKNPQIEKQEQSCIPGLLQKDVDQAANSCGLVEDAASPGFEDVADSSGLEVTAAAPGLVEDAASPGLEEGADPGTRNIELTHEEELAAFDAFLVSRLNRLAASTAMGLNF